MKTFLKILKWFGIIFIVVSILTGIGLYAWFQKIQKDADIVESWSQNDGEIIENISYGPKGERNLLDIFIPKNLDKSQKQDLILFIHGGSWIGGDKKDVYYNTKRYAKEGFITATMNYTFPAEGQEYSTSIIMNEITTAIAKIRDELAQRGYTINSMGIGGDSAGGHLSMLYALSQTENHIFPIKMIYTRVAPTNFYKNTWHFGDEFSLGMVNIFLNTNYTLEDYKSGKIDDEIAKVSPASFISEKSPAMVFAYGGKDATIGVNHHQILIEKLEKYKIDYKFFYLPDGSHVLAENPEIIKEFTETGKKYFKKYLKNPEK